MNVTLYTDNTLDLNLDSIVNLLNSNCKSVQFKKGNERIHLADDSIRNPETYDALPKSILKVKSRNFNVICTSIPYEDACFFSYPKRVIIISFDDWHKFTNLPLSNGLIFFIASILCDEFHIGHTHEKDTGCINDFWLNKSAINAGMRAAFLCHQCRSSLKGKQKIIADVEQILDLVSVASRQNKDVQLTNKVDDEFDVFLCHNSADKSVIRKINKRLKEKGIKTWLDEEQLPPGLPWQPVLEKQIQKIRTACVFVGSNGSGPWQSAEVRAFLHEFVNRNCPVIPVILQGIVKDPELPLFLKEMNWIDLRENPNLKFRILVNAIKGNK